MADRAAPRFYFSLRSPYSWLAYRQLLEHHADVARLLQWKPFWEPDEGSARALAARGGQFPYSAMSKAKHLYVLQDVARLARAAGLSPTWPVDRDPVWEVAHLAYLVARDRGQGPAYIEAVYRARWQQGRDICDPATIGEIGSELGLDGTELAGAWRDERRREQGVGLLLDVCRDGVFGVPFFVHGHSRFWGVDRLTEFAEHLRSRTALADRMPEPVAAVGLDRGGDQGHAGGCG
ncbi:2-hydroxychromene-2-carboxylate isomerase [Kutzneria buriramensis]|uniref:2-hydroxychromene-2-carboxylate isomerase n=1 Tax=Kutzneria buriramensis TaxID=1045776 RepID=A0A3E0HQ17_9PSEU|nr:DsbA family protein [Kutzneria buriramensis]REH48481.1 2-hydroxychromene-2-carboxylate isomerase [Kutzneria buriramensis]